MSHGLRASVATSAGRFRRRSGSPPVSLQPSDAEFREELRQPIDLLERQQVFPRQPDVLVLRHAVVTAQVAAIGHRQAEGAKRATERINDSHNQALRARREIATSIRLPMHPGGRRCSALTYAGYARFSRLGRRAPRHPNRRCYFAAGPNRYNRPDASPLSRPSAGGRTRPPSSMTARRSSATSRSARTAASG